MVQFTEEGKACEWMTGGCCLQNICAAGLGISVTPASVGTLCWFENALDFSMMMPMMSTWWYLLDDLYDVDLVMHMTLTWWCLYVDLMFIMLTWSCLYCLTWWCIWCWLYDVDLMIFMMLIWLFLRYWLDAYVRMPITMSTWGGLYSTGQKMPPDTTVIVDWA